MRSSILLKFVLIAGLFSSSFALHASCETAESGMEFYFVVWLEGGGIVTYPLDEKPQVTYHDGQLKISIDVEEVYIEPDKVNKFTINNTKPDEDLTGVEGNYIINQKLEKGNDYISFVGCRAGMDVYVYTLGGVLVKQSQTDSSGMLYLSLEELECGVYIVKSEEITCKILKR